MYNYVYKLYTVFRELEARLQKQTATREYVQEFIKKKEEVSKTEYLVNRDVAL